MNRTARNQARYRQRLRNGQRVFLVTLPEHELADLLTVVGILTPDEADDPAALRHGLEEFLHRQFHVIANSMPGQYQL